jgi:hypothetical protein
MRRRNHTLDSDLDIATLELELGDILFLQKLNEFSNFFLVHRPAVKVFATNL